MERILVVDDEPSIVAVIQGRLESEGFSVDAVATGEEALTNLEIQAADVLVLDVMLPGIDGFEVLRRLRSAGSLIPVILLTARDEDIDKIVGLELGADDYMVKPFNPRELSARIRAVLRRQAEIKALKEQVPQFQADDNHSPGDQHGIADQNQASDLDPPSSSRSLEFEANRRRVWFHGQLMDLRPKEYELLHFLASHREQVFTREVLLTSVWGDDRFIDERTIDVHIRRLRGKLAAIAPDEQLIFTEWGVGYWLAADG